MAICHLSLSPVFTDATCNLLGGCWLCYLLGDKEKKENRLVVFSLVQSVVQGLALDFVSLFLFPRDINTLGIKMKSETQIKAQHLHFHVLLSEEAGKVIHDLFVCRASVLSKIKGYPAKLANASTSKLKWNW